MLSFLRCEILEDYNISKAVTQKFATLAAYSTGLERQVSLMPLGLNFHGQDMSTVQLQLSFADIRHCRAVRRGAICSTGMVHDRSRTHGLWAVCAKSLACYLWLVVHQFMFLWFPVSLVATLGLCNSLVPLQCVSVSVLVLISLEIVTSQFSGNELKQLNKDGSDGSRAQFHHRWNLKAGQADL